MPAKSPAPPRPELIALLDAIKDNPDEDTPRLVLADWLDEQGNELDAERAAFIRGDIAEFRAGRKVHLLAGDRTAREAFTRRWLGPLVDLTTTGFVGFRRGLPSLTIAGERFLQPDVPALLATEAFAFVDYVHLDDTGGRRAGEIVSLPEFRHVTGLSIYPFYPFGADAAVQFLASPNLSGLRRLILNHVNPGAAGPGALARNPAAARLRKLSLLHNKLPDKAAVALAESPHLTNLQTLDLSNNLIRDSGAAAVADSPHLANLRELNLRDNPRLTEAGKKLLRDTFGDRVRLS